MTQRPDQNAHKRGKTRFELIPLAFVREMADVMAAGLRETGRWVDSWKELDPVELPHYRAAILRHLEEVEKDPRAIDAKSGKSHWVHIATSAMIAWWLSWMVRVVKTTKARGKV
jgi:hypothetical protein